MVAVAVVVQNLHPPLPCYTCCCMGMHSLMFGLFSSTAQTVMSNVLHELRKIKGYGDGMADILYLQLIQHTNVYRQLILNGVGRAGSAQAVEGALLGCR